MNVWFIVAHLLAIQISSSLSVVIKCGGMCHPKSNGKNENKPFICSAKSINHMIWGHGPTIPAELPDSIRASWSIASKTSSPIQLSVRWKMTGAQISQEYTSFLLLLIRARAYEKKFQIDIRKNHNYSGKSVYTKKIKFLFEYCELKHGIYIQPAMTYYWNFMSLPVYEQTKKTQRKTSVAVPGLHDDISEYEDTPDDTEAALVSTKKFNEKGSSVEKIDDEDYDQDGGSGKESKVHFVTKQTTVVEKMVSRRCRRKRKEVFVHGRRFCLRKKNS